MVKKLTVECRQCHQVSDLFLTTDARVVIFNCPSCWSTLMYHDGGLYVLNHAQVQQIVNSTDQGEMTKVLQSITGKAAELVAVPGSTRGEKKSAVGVRCAEGGTEGHVLQRSQECVLTSDDVVNLRIELETCADVAEFLSHL